MNKRKNMILDELQDLDISFFSFTLFSEDGKRSLLSHCNNEEWLDTYQRQFVNCNKMPPVYKYISSSALKMIIWDSCNIDDMTKEYIDIRNKVTNVSSNVSVLFKTQVQPAVITLGSARGTPHLLKTLASNKTLLDFRRYLLSLK